MTQMLPSFDDALKQLIAAPSISSTLPKMDMGNRAVTELLANWLQARGFEVQLQSLTADQQKVNLYASYGSGRGGLVFSGHTDTVPCDPSLWNAEPFSVIETPKGYQGLGTTDMKGFFAVLIESLAKIDLLRLQKPLMIVATADEETSMCGARGLLLEKVAHADAVIIGEPTDLQPIRMHKGIMMEGISIDGIGGHSSDPELGLNALEVMYEVMGGLLSMRKALQKDHHHAGFPISVPTLNLGCIHGGDNPNRICSHCEIEFDLRTLPGMSVEKLRADLDAMSQKIAKKWGCAITRRSLFPGIDSFELEADAQLVVIAEKLSGQPSRAVSFATEAPFYKAFGLDTLVLGPGSIDQAHAINEYLPGQQIQPAVNLYRNLINHYCMG